MYRVSPGPAGHVAPRAVWDREGGSRPVRKRGQGGRLTPQLRDV